MLRLYLVATITVNLKVSKSWPEPLKILQMGHAILRGDAHFYNRTHCVAKTFEFGPAPQGCATSVLLCEVTSVGSSAFLMIPRLQDCG